MNQYIITEEQLNHFDLYLNADTRKVCSDIRSNPYNPQADGCNLNPTCEGCNSQPSFVCENSVNPQAERDKVLKELKKDLQSRFVSSNNQWSRGRNSGLLECCNIIDEYLTTFRTGAKEIK